MKGTFHKVNQPLLHVFSDSLQNPYNCNILEGSRNVAVSCAVIKNVQMWPYICETPHDRKYNFMYITVRVKMMIPKQYVGIVVNNPLEILFLTL
jgi:hypothetical protein